MKTIGLDGRLLHSSWVTGRKWSLSELLNKRGWSIVAARQKAKELVQCAESWQLVLI